LAGRSQISLFKRLKKDNWQIILFFLWIPNAAFSKSRIRERVKHGGHNIPDETIYRRFPRIMNNFIKIYIPLYDKVICYDNSGPKFVPVFEQDGKVQHVVNENIYEIILRQLNEKDANE
jgi:predicted ABC-type ATPase